MGIRDSIYIMDTTLPLDQQMYDEENTWQQMFLNAGLSMFQYLSLIHICSRVPPRQARWTPRR